MTTSTNLRQSAGINLFIVLILTIIFQSFLFLSLIKKLRCNKARKKNKKKTKYQCLVFGVFSSFIIWAITLLVALISLWIATNDLIISQENINGSFTHIMFVFSDCSILIATLFGYLSNIYRLYETFNGTLFAPKLSTIYLHVMIALFSPTLIAMVYTPHLDSYNDYIVALILDIIMLFGAIHLIYLFNYKLYQLVLHQKTSLNLNNIGLNQNADIELNERQLNTLKTLRKHTLLCTITILLVAMAIFVIIIGNEYIFHELSDSENDSSTLWIYFSICAWVLVICINGIVLCIWFGFTVNGIYYKFFCNGCDACCQRLCIKCTTKKINKPQQNEYILMNDDDEL